MVAGTATLEQQAEALLQKLEQPCEEPLASLSCAKHQLAVPPREAQQVWAVQEEQHSWEKGTGGSGWPADAAMQTAGAGAPGNCSMTAATRRPGSVSDLHTYTPSSLRTGGPEKPVTAGQGQYSQQQQPELSVGSVGTGSISGGGSTSTSTSSTSSAFHQHGRSSGQGVPSNGSSGAGRSTRSGASSGSARAAHSTAGRALSVAAMMAGKQERALARAEEAGKWRVREGVVKLAI